MKTSSAGRLALMQREGVRLHAYQDERGVWTIGCGHTTFAGSPVVYPGMIITNVECDRILAADLARFEAAVDHALATAIAHGWVTQHMYDACVSLAYNIGANGFIGSTVAHKMNQDDARGAADAFLLWDRPADLLTRRESERAQFLTSD